MKVCYMVEQTTAAEPQLGCWWKAASSENQKIPQLEQG